MAGDLNHLSPHADFSYVILLFYPLIGFTDVRKWTGGYFYTKNMQFENVSFIKVSHVEKFFQHAENNGKSAMLSFLVCLMQECEFKIISIQIGRLRYINEV